MKHYLRLLTLATSAFCTSAYAGGVGKISTPLIDEGVLEMEYTGVRYGDDRASLNNKQSHTLELEYGFTPRLMVGLETKIERESPNGAEFSLYGIEAQYELTTQKNWWFDSAIKAEYGVATDDEDADEGELQLLLLRNFGKTEVVANIGFEREVGDNRGAGVDVGSKLRLSQELNEHFAPGIEWQANYGKLNKLDTDDEREHYVGPSAHGEIFELGASELSYDLGYFWGLTDDTADNAVRLKLSYEVKF